MRRLDAGQSIFFTEHPATRLYVVASGAVKLTGMTPDAKEVLLDVLGSGSFLGTLPALGGDTYAENAWALTAGCVLAFTGAQFDAVLDEHPQVARSALAAVGQRLRAAQERIERTSAASAPVRIASTLLMLADRLGIDQGERIVIDVPLAREDLASMSGCAAETVSRSLAIWSREGIIETGRRWVALRRPDVLAEVAGI